MSDTERPRPKGPLDAPDLYEPGPITGAFQVPLNPALAFEDPLSADVAVFINLAAKAAKGIRVYAPNNETLRRYIDEAYRALCSILERTIELTLTVREDRFLHNKDVVHINSDREDSLPFIFYRNAFRRVVLVHGMTREEMLQLLSAMVADYGGFDYAGEDLCTSLWRISLPHLRYLTIDAMSTDAKNAKSQLERDEIERIQADIEGIVAMIYKNSATDEDIVAGVSITKEDLEALKEIRAEGDEDLDALDVATARAISNIPQEALDAMSSEMLVESRDSLTTKLLDILIIVAFKEQSSAESAMTLELIQQLFDAMLVSQRYPHATHLVERLNEHQRTTYNLKEKHIALHLLRIFASEARIIPLLNTFNDDYKTKSVTELIDFLRSLGASIVPHLLSSLDFLNSPAHRRLACDMILEHGIPDRKLLIQRMTGAKWFLARDILHIASKLPPNDLAPLVDMGLKSEHPKVREYAVGLLRPYARGSADKLVAERLLDDDLEVRLAAIRVAAARKTPDTRAAFEVLIEREDLQDREPRELRLLMAAYAAICGGEAVSLLDKILAPSLFGKTKLADAQIAAAFALASIGTLAANAALQRGTRTLSTRVREACKKALAGAYEKSPSTDLPVSFDGTGTGPHTALTPPPAIQAVKTDPLQAPPARPSIPPAQGTPVANRSAKAMGVSADAPDFNTSPAALPEDKEKKREQHPQFLTGPALGRVHSVQQKREEIPMRALMGTPVESTSPNIHDPSEEPTMHGVRVKRERTPIPLDPSALMPRENTPLPPPPKEDLRAGLKSRAHFEELDLTNPMAPPSTSSKSITAMDPAETTDHALRDAFAPLGTARGGGSLGPQNIDDDELDLMVDEVHEARTDIFVQTKTNVRDPSEDLPLDLGLESFALPSKGLEERKSDRARAFADPRRDEDDDPPLGLDSDSSLIPALPPRPMSFPPSVPPPLPPSRTPPPNARGMRETLPALPDMELPTLMREVNRPKDRTGVPSRREQPPPLPSKPAIPPAKTNPGLTDDLFLDQEPSHAPRKLIEDDDG